jgi:hypothetical protein
MPGSSDPSLSHPLTLLYMGAGLAGKRGGSVDVAAKYATQAARDPHLNPPPFRGRKQQASRSRLDDNFAQAARASSP